MMNVNTNAEKICDDCRKSGYYAEYFTNQGVKTAHKMVTMVTLLQTWPYPQQVNMPSPVPINTSLPSPIISPKTLAHLIPPTFTYIIIIKVISTALIHQLQIMATPNWLRPNVRMTMDSCLI